MRTLILAAGRFGDGMRRSIADGKEPRLDVFELAGRLHADVVDYLDVEHSRRARVLSRIAGASVGVAHLGFLGHKRYDAILTTGEDIGLPLALALKAARARVSHTMIAHTLFPAKKRAFFQIMGVASHIDRILVYSTSEEGFMVETLRIPQDKIERIPYHADELFFAPDEHSVERDLVCAAGQLLRDYDCLIEAVRDLPVRVEIAAGSPWIERGLQPGRPLPTNVTWGKLNRFALRQLYRRAAVAVVPIRQNHYQTGIATILEMMAMGKCVIATRTLGQTDTIVDGETGIYVPPGDPVALRQAIQRALSDPDETARIGKAARRYVEEHAGLNAFTERLAGAVRAGREHRHGKR